MFPQAYVPTLLCFSHKGSIFLGFYVTRVPFSQDPSSRRPMFPCSGSHCAARKCVSPKAYSSPMIPCPQWTTFLRIYIHRVPCFKCSQTFMLQGFSMFKYPLCCVLAETSHVPRVLLHVARVPYSQSSIFPELTLFAHQPKVLRLLYLPGALFRVSNVPQLLCLYGPMFPWL